MPAPLPPADPADAAQPHHHPAEEPHAHPHGAAHTHQDDTHVHMAGEPVEAQPIEVVIPAEPRVVVEEVPAGVLPPATVVYLQYQAQIFLVLRSILGFIEVLLGLRFLLMLFGANPGALFFDLVYNLSLPFVFVFDGLFQNPRFGLVTFELTTLFAMLFYLFSYWWVVRLIRLLAPPPLLRH